MKEYIPTAPSAELFLNYQQLRRGRLEQYPKPVQYICCSHRRMTQASHWNEENYRHYIAAFQHYTKMVSKQVDSVLKALYSTPAGKNTIVIIMLTMVMGWLHTAW